MTTRAPLCSHCGQPAELTTGRAVYPHREDLWDKRFWACWACQAWCGCHSREEGTTPLGTPANAQLRKLRSQVHREFDPFWQSGVWDRRQAYSWLARKMRIPVDDTHVGQFTANQCLLALQCVRARRKGKTHE